MGADTCQPLFGRLLLDHYERKKQQKNYSLSPPTPPGPQTCTMSIVFPGNETATRITNRVAQRDTPLLTRLQKERTGLTHGSPLAFRLRSFYTYNALEIS